MRTVVFGKCGVEVPAVSLGAWAYGGPNEAGGRAVGWGAAPGDAFAAALRAAYERGITHWDTADVYGDGRSEQVIGEAFGDVPRDAIFLATKVGWDRGAHAGWYHPDLVQARLERSLRLLRTDHIDLYYLHHCDFGEDDARLDGALEVLHRARDAGKIRFLGLSDWSPSKVARLLPRVAPDAIQPYRNVLHDRYGSSGLAAVAAEAKVGVAFFSPLRHGLLTGKYDAPPTFAPGDHRANVPEFTDPAALERARKAAQALAARFGSSPQPVLRGVLGALLEDTPNACVLVGMRNPAQVHAAADALDAPLGADEAAWVRSLYRNA